MFSGNNLPLPLDVLRSSTISQGHTFLLIGGVTKFSNDTFASLGHIYRWDSCHCSGIYNRPSPSTFEFTLYPRYEVEEDSWTKLPVQLPDWYATSAVWIDPDFCDWNLTSTMKEPRWQDNQNLKTMMLTNVYLSIPSMYKITFMCVCTYFPLYNDDYLIIQIKTALMLVFTITIYLLHKTLRWQYIW